MLQILKSYTLISIICLSAFSSCIVQSPKYSTLEQVMTLKLGMTKVEVEEVLGVKSYDLKARNDTSDVYIYIYRVLDRRTFSFNTKPVNGKIATGKYVQLEIAYSKAGTVVNIESCNLCPDNLVSTSKVDFAKVIVFITVTLPVLMIYFGLKN